MKEYKERVRLSSYHTHSHSLGRMSERGEAPSSERERTTIGDHLFCLWVLLLPLVLILYLRKLHGFSLYGFPEENALCLFSLVIICVHVILLDKILRSYCLNDKNLKPFLLTFGIFNRKVHNCMIDLGESSNAMPVSV